MTSKILESADPLMNVAGRSLRSHTSNGGHRPFDQTWLPGATTIAAKKSIHPSPWLIESEGQTFLIWKTMEEGEEEEEKRELPRNRSRKERKEGGGSL